MKRLCVVLCGLWLGISMPTMATPAPDFALPDLQGGQIALADLEGQVVLLDFWASWCVPCRASAAALQELQREFADADLRIVPISVDEDRAAAQAFWARYGGELLSLHDPQGTVAEAYDLLGMPSSFVIDKQGQLVSRHEGYRKGDEEVWREEIRRLLSAD